MFHAGFDDSFQARPGVQWKTPDDGQKNCPKHVKFLDKNRFGKLVGLLV
jgi:hypothetical protein